jgi:hypothetical protein
MANTHCTDLNTSVEQPLQERGNVSGAEMVDLMKDYDESARATHKRITNRILCGKAVLIGMGEGPIEIDYQTPFGFSRG